MEPALGLEEDSTISAGIFAKRVVGHIDAQAFLLEHHFGVHLRHLAKLQSKLDHARISQPIKFWSRSPGENLR
jgi:hypothetical protein